MVSVLCKCGHDVFGHGVHACGGTRSDGRPCGCTHVQDTVLLNRLRESDRIRKMCAQLAAADAAEKLQPVVIQPAVERSA